MAEALQSDYDVIMVDARGHGRSEAPEQTYGPLELADDLADVIAALGLRRPAILGHSVGASTALTLAGTHPDMPSAILLEDPPAWWTAKDEPLDDEVQEHERLVRRIWMRRRGSAGRRCRGEEKPLEAAWWI